jgi:opacity protein-like surface antigen
MKKIALSFALICASLSAFGQQNELRTNLPNVEGTKRGFFIGVDYMNLTDLTAKFETKSKDGSYHNTANYTETGHIGMGGLRLGYNQTPTFGPGFNAGLRMVETLNRSEWGGDNKVQMFIPEANFQFAFGENFVPYIGLNTSLWTGSSTMNVYRPGLGAQAGISFQFKRSVALNLGYTLLTQTYEQDDSGYESKGDIQTGGFTTSVNYTF